MKKRKMKLAFVMTALITSISFVGAVKAVVKINETNIIVDNNLFYKVYDNKENNSTNNVGCSPMKYITVDSKNAYCIDFGTQLGTYTNETDDHAQTLLSYLTDNGLTEAAAKDAVNKAMLYNYFGYNSGVKGRDTYQYYLATQQLIWETLNDTGFFKSPNTIKNDLMDNEIKGGYDISNIRFLKTSTDSHNRCSEKPDYDENSTINVNDTKQSIINASKNFGRIPSFANDKIGEIKVGESVTLEDTNKVLQYFTITECSDNAECTISGNNLTIKAIDEGDITIKFNRTYEALSNGLNVKESMVYGYDRQNSNGDKYISQRVAAIVGKPADVPFTMTTKGYSNPETSNMKIAYIALISLFAIAMTFIYYFSRKNTTDTSN